MAATVIQPGYRAVGGEASAAAGARGVDASLQDAAPSFDDPPLGISVRRSKVPKAEVADMTAQLAIMTQSGLDLSSALKSLAAQCERPALAEVLQDVNELVHSGNTLSDSLKMHPDVFDGAYVATVAAAEASGRMPEILKQLATMQRSELRLIQSIRALLTYPILLTCVAGLVISILVVFVLPRFATIFEEHDVELPIITQVLLSIADEIKYRWWLWIPALGAAAIGVFSWRRTESGRRAFDAWLLKAPTVGGVASPLFTGRFCTLLGLLLNSGVPLVESLRLCRQAASNCVFKDVIAELVESVLNGHGMSSVLAEAVQIPASAREMIITGERTGKLAEVAQLLGSHYEEEAENRMKHVVRVLEPLITVVMGAVVAVVVLAVMLPIFDLSQAAH